MSKDKTLLVCRDYKTFHLAPDQESLSFCGNEQPPRGTAQRLGWWAAAFCSKAGSHPNDWPGTMSEELCFECLVKWTAAQR